MFRLTTLPFLKKDIIVLDEFGHPLPNVNILFSNGQGTITDSNGRATVKAVFITQILTFSHIGFGTESIAFKDIEPVVTLISETTSLDEVIIIATKPKPKPTPPPKSKPKSQWWIYPVLAVAALGIIKVATPKKSPKRKIKM
ncbi:hypothetical protein [Dokdonia sp.]|uniref:hypothetical protein n=1 Tax=Dokdonia sp. TaxID=2024995 RepID=UPI00326752B6